MSSRIMTGPTSRRNAKSTASSVVRFPYRHMTAATSSSSLSIVMRDMPQH